MKWRTFLSFFFITILIISGCQKPDGETVEESAAETVAEADTEGIPVEVSAEDWLATAQAGVLCQSCPLH